MEQIKIKNNTLRLANTVFLPQKRSHYDNDYIHTVIGLLPLSTAPNASPAQKTRVFGLLSMQMALWIYVRALKALTAVFRGAQN
jgi:hypothetical protein